MDASYLAANAGVFEKQYYKIEIALEIQKENDSTKTIRKSG